MILFLEILVVLAMVATLGVLVAGMVGMARGGDPMRSNRLMRYRVLLQAAALILFMILMSLIRH